MTPEQQRIAIAELCGWTEIRTPGWTGYTKIWVPLCSGESDEKPGHYLGYIPDYLNDLNAMHEAEKVLGNKWDTYVDHLCSLQPEEHFVIKCVMFATAAQRREAFLKTLGKWTD